MKKKTGERNAQPFKLFHRVLEYRQCKKDLQNVALGFFSKFHEIAAEFRIGKFRLHPKIAIYVPIHLVSYKTLHNLYSTDDGL
jgi:hypothetical protein